MRIQAFLITLLFASFARAGHPVFYEYLPDDLPLPPALEEIFNDGKGTYYYNSFSAPRMTQHRSRVYSARHQFNSGGNETNGNTEFPWAVGGGLHDVDERDALLEKFFRHPQHKPIRYYKSERSNGFGVPRSNGRVTRQIPPASPKEDGLDCKFPIDMTVGETMTLKWKGHSHVFEVRTLVCEPDTWQDYTYRRWNTRDNLVKLIRGIGGYDTIAETISQLPKHPRQIRNETRRVNPEVRHLFEFDFWEVDIPRLPDDLVSKLLATTPLTEVYEESDLYFPSGQLLPVGYHPAMVGIGDDCKKCHVQAGVQVQFIAAGDDWYPYVSGTGKAKDLTAPFSIPFLQPSNGGPLEPNRELVALGFLKQFHGEAGYQE